jgi:hypothetical protein
MRSDETSAVHVSVNTMSSRVSNHAGDYMLDLVKVAARERRYAQNV